MPRLSRNVLLLAKPETTAGVDAAPTPAADSVLVVGNVEITPIELNTVDRNLSYTYFGGSQLLIGTYYSKVSFTVELSGSGTAGTSAQWGDLLIGSGCAEASLTTPTRIESTPISTALKTLTLYFYDDGILHKITGAYGNVKLSANVGEVPKLQCEMMGTYSPATAVSLPTGAYSAWKAPVPINKANTLDLLFGCAYSAGAFSGGTAIPYVKFELDMGNKTSFYTSSSTESAVLTDRDSKLSFELELGAAAEVTALSDILANVTTSVGLTLGTVSGAKMLVHLPSIQRTSIKKSDREGVRIVGFEAKVLPVSGNDEFRFVQL